MRVAEHHRRAPMAVLFFCVLLAGCVTTRNFETIPSEPSHFELPREELEAEFPEVTLYEDSFRVFFLNTPSAITLIDREANRIAKKVQPAKRGWAFCKRPSLLSPFLTPAYS